MKTPKPILALLLAALLVTGCTGSFNGIRSAWSPDNKSATIARLKATAEPLLGQAAVSMLMAYGASGGDMSHSSASAIWKQGAYVGIQNIAKLVTDAGGSTALASAAQGVAQQAITTGVTKQEVANAVASAISAGALQ